MRYHRRLPCGFLVPVFLLALGVAGCAPYKAQVVPPWGVIYSEFSAPLILPKPGSDLGDPEKVEVYTAHFRVPLLYGGVISFGWGDASLNAAIRRSGFQRIHYADCEWFSVLSAYNRLTINVYGHR